MNIYKITPKYHVTGVLWSESVIQLKRLGVVKVMCNRLDSEAPFDSKANTCELPSPKREWHLIIFPWQWPAFHLNLSAGKKMRFLIQMAVSLPMRNGTSLYHLMGPWICASTRARGFLTAGSACGHGHRIHETSPGPDVLQRAALLTNSEYNIIDDPQSIHAITWMRLIQDTTYD